MSRRQSFSSFGATSFEHEASVLSRHASAEAMRLCASSVVRLKSALRHRNEFSLKTKMVRLAAPCVYVKETRAQDFSVQPLCSLCLCGDFRPMQTTETRRTQRLHRESSASCSTMMCTGILPFRRIFNDRSEGDHRVLFYSSTLLD